MRLAALLLLAAGAGAAGFEQELAQAPAPETPAVCTRDQALASYRPRLTLAGDPALDLAFVYESCALVKGESSVYARRVYRSEAGGYSLEVWTAGGSEASTVSVWQGYDLAPRVPMRGRAALLGEFDTAALLKGDVPLGAVKIADFPRRRQYEGVAVLAPSK